MKILLIGAHPDDISLGMLGTVLKHTTNKDEVHAIIATKGEMWGDEDQRAKDSENCLTKAGVKTVSFLGFMDTRIKCDVGTINVIEKHVKKIRPDRVYTHTTRDIHQDHRNLSEAVVTAARNVGQILFFESPSSQIYFQPNFFVDITSFIDKKQEFLQGFTGGIQEQWYMEIEAIKGTALFRGYQSKKKYAEAFEVFKFVN